LSHFSDVLPLIIPSGDTFIIISRARGWWFVQRDQEAKGIVEIDPSKQGWVPAGCLLETSVPVAVAIEEAALAIKSKASFDGNTLSPVSKTPILPLSILSTSFPGVALMEYTKKGEEELDLMKDDTLRVFKRYNHWSYVSACFFLYTLVLIFC
jgi:bZIP factor